MQAAIETDWKQVLDRKQAQIIKNNKFENAKRIEHHYQVGDYVKITHEKNSRMRPTKLSAPCEGPCRVLIVHADSTVTIQRGGHREKLSVTRIAPYFNKNSSASTAQD